MSEPTYCDDCEIWTSPGTLYKQVAPGKYKSDHVQRVKLCPKHAAVDDLLAAAKMALEEDWYRRDIDYYEEWLIVTSALRTAIAKAEPQP